MPVKSLLFRQCFVIETAKIYSLWVEISNEYLMTVLYRQKQTSIYFILLPGLYNSKLQMEADPPSEERTEQRVEVARDLEEQPAEEDSWFDDESEKEEKEDEDEVENKGKLSIAVGQSEQPSPTLKVPAEQSSEFSRYSEYSGYDHQVDYNYLVLLLVLNGYRIVDLKQISGLKEGYIEIVSKQRKLIVKTTCEQAAGEAIERISAFVDKLSVLKLDLRGDAACRFSNFSLLKDHLRKDGVVMFGTSSKERRQLYIGGAMRPSELRVFQEQLRSFRVVLVFLRALRNTRSYRLIVEALLGLECMQRTLLAFNQVKLAEVERRNRFREMRVTLGSISLKEFTANDYEDVLMRQVRKCCVVAFCFTASERFIEKPRVEGVAFKIITERAVRKSYLYVMAGKEEWVGKQQEIRAEVGRLENVVGVRFFYHIFPHLHLFQFSRERYYCFRYPQGKPYSVSVSARTREGFTFNTQAFLDRVVQVCQDQEAKGEVIE